MLNVRIASHTILIKSKPHCEQPQGKKEHWGVYYDACVHIEQEATSLIEPPSDAVYAIITALAMLAFLYFSFCVRPHKITRNFFLVQIIKNLCTNQHLYYRIKQLNE